MAITCFFCVILDRTCVKMQCVKMQCLIRAWYVRQFANTIVVNYALSRYIWQFHPSVPSFTVRRQYLRIWRQMFYASLLTLSLEFDDNSSTWVWWQSLSSFTITAFHHVVTRYCRSLCWCWLWLFNPPALSHMGGVWERKIRTVRKVLATVMKKQLVSDESLNTLFCLVESIINGRPLTTVSDDPKDLNPLTPNHMLLLQPRDEGSPGLFDKQDFFCRRRWRQIQYLADVF